MGYSVAVTQWTLTPPSLVQIQIAQPKGRTAFSRKVWLFDRLYGNRGFHILSQIKEWGTVSTKAAFFLRHFLRKEQCVKSGFTALIIYLSELATELMIND